MEIELKKITVRALVKDYEDKNDDGVRGYGGKLDIRPPFQREFIYKIKQRDAVIKTVNNGFPLNVMYWAKQDDGTFEIIDGQQRTISICQYVTNVFSFESLYFNNLEDDQQKKFLDYELMVYLCSGTDSEKLEWFKIINIAGIKLADQELRNAVYHGFWVSDAKKWFSKTSCPAYVTGHNYLNGSAIRQDYLETTIRWISKDQINEYMAKNQHKKNASQLWQYFQAVITWVESTFKVTRPIMKGIEWGLLYNDYKDIPQDVDQLEKETARLIADKDVTKKSGIYQYLLTGEERHLYIRAFDEDIKQKVYDEQNGNCNICKKYFEFNEMEADHITPWSQGGQTVEDNCQLLCRDDNRRKSAK